MKVVMLLMNSGECLNIRLSAHCPQLRNDDETKVKEEWRGKKKEKASKRASRAPLTLENPKSVPASHASESTQTRVQHY